MSITIGILDIVRAAMKKNGVDRLKAIRISVGEVTAVEPESLKFCFEACIKDTPLEGAALEIEEVPLTGRCNSCGEEFRLERYFTTPCPACGKSDAEIIAGRELEIISMEVE